MKNGDAAAAGNPGATRRKRFKVYKTAVGLDVQAAGMRSDFVKIYLVAGNAHIHVGGKTTYTSDPILLFEPLAPYSINEVTGSGQSFSCLFSENLLRSELCSGTYRKLMAFAAASGPVFFRLDSKQKNFITVLFERIILEQDTSYVFNHELFCNYMNLILHEVLKKTSAKIPAYQPFHLN